MSINKRKYWDHNNAEILYYTEIDDAIENYLDGLNPIPKEIEMIEYESKVLPIDCIELKFGLTNILENIDEIYGNPEDDYTIPTDNMIKAYETLKDIIVKEYQVWSCEKTGKKQLINCEDWVRNNRPDWVKI